jgi:hypothetical protein
MNPLRILYFIFSFFMWTRRLTVHTCFVFMTYSTFYEHLSLISDPGNVVCVYLLHSLFYKEFLTQNTKQGLYLSLSCLQTVLKKHIFVVHDSWVFTYSKIPVISHEWGMGCAIYMNLLHTWGKILQKSNAKSEQHIFTLVLMWVFSYAAELIDEWNISDTYTVTWPQI